MSKVEDNNWVFEEKEEKDYSVEISSFDRVKPVGVSGLLRIKNDADFVAESIDSCIEALDELVITYQDSVDNTLDIILQKKKQYPDKIRIYYYKPKILSHELSDADYELATSYSMDSVHLLANYYNYTLSKAQYRYAMKIDADQISFTDKLKAFCDLYRCKEKVAISLSEDISYQYYFFLIRLFAKLPFLFNRFVAPLFFPEKLMTMVERYTKKKIQNDKVISSFSGLNIFKSTRIGVAAGTYDNGVQPPINGSGDHLIFPISGKTYYQPLYEKDLNRIVEIMRSSEKIYWGGFLWFHLHAMRKNYRKERYELYCKNMIEFNELLNTNFLSLEKKYGFIISGFMRPVIYSFLIADKNDLKKYISDFKNRI